MWKLAQTIHVLVVTKAYAPRKVLPAKKQSLFLKERCISMKTKYVTKSTARSITATTSCAASAEYLAKRITQQTFAFMLALAIMIGIAAVATPLAPAQTLTVLHSFTGNPDGSMPYGSLVRDSSGNLYGTTTQGGTSGNGTVFKTTSTGTTTVLHSFSGTPDGSTPYGALAIDASGNLYGTTIIGGTSNNGTVFKTTSTGTTTLLHNFAGNPDGSRPYGGLVRDSSGNLYSTTSQGGSSNLGTVFKTTSAGTTTVLHSFVGTPDGSGPYGGLVVDSSGNLYGTTVIGGTSNNGTVFKTTSTGTTTLLHNFAGNPDGSRPYGGLVRDSSGNLYSTTSQGGSSNLGTVFKTTSTGTTTVLHNFAGNPDGSSPYYDGLVRDSSGNLYGTTTQGGSSNLGTVFKTTSAGTTTVLHSFVGTPDGSGPYGGLVVDSSGNLYGTTVIGGTSNNGTVFKTTSTGTTTLLHNFAGN